MRLFDVPWDSSVVVIEGACQRRQGMSREKNMCHGHVDLRVMLEQRRMKRTEDRRIEVRYRFDVAVERDVRVHSMTCYRSCHVETACGDDSHAYLVAVRLHNRCHR